MFTAVFQSGVPPASSIERALGAPVPYQPCIRHSFILAILVGVEWYLLTVFICISLTTNYVERLFF